MTGRKSNFPVSATRHPNKPLLFYYSGGKGNNGIGYALRRDNESAQVGIEIFVAFACAVPLGRSA